MAKRKDVYKSYLLRVWRDEENGRYRIRLEDVSAADQVRYFADIDGFISFLLLPEAGAGKNHPTGGLE